MQGGGIERTNKASLSVPLSFRNSQITLFLDEPNKYHHSLVTALEVIYGEAFAPNKTLVGS